MTAQAPPAAAPAALPIGGVVPAGMAKACDPGCEAPVVTQLPPVWPSPTSDIGGGGDTVASIPEAPLDGIQYGRQSASWTPVVAGGGGLEDAPSNLNSYARRAGLWVTCIPTAGGMITGGLSVAEMLQVPGHFTVNPTNGYSDFFGRLRVAATPELPTEVATKQYVDGLIAAIPAPADAVLASGDTMTGPLVLPGNAVNPLEAVPLQQLTVVSTEMASGIDVAKCALEAKIERLNGLAEALQARIDTLEKLQTMLEGKGAR